MKKLTAVLLLLSVCLCFGGCGSKNATDQKSDSSTALVTVNGTVITTGEFDTYFDNFCAFNQLENTAANKEYYIQAGLLDSYILKYLVEEKATAEGVDTSDEAIEKEITASVVSAYGSVDNFISQYLDPIGVSWQEAVDFMHSDFVYYELVNLRLLNSDIDFEAMYEANKASYQAPEQVAASHILVADEATANDIIAQLNDGADFAKLAGEYSTDTVSAINGGYLGYFTRETMVSEFSDAAFALAVGSYSQQAVKSQFGYHIILVKDHTQAHQMSYEEAYSYLLQDASIEIENALYNELMNSADIVYN